MDMEHLPASVTPIEDRLRDISLKIFIPEKIEINALTMSEVERDRRSADHIKTSLSCFGEERKKIDLFGREYIYVHGRAISGDIVTSMKGYVVLGFVRVGS